MSETTLDFIFNSLGIIGVSLIILSYFLLQKGIWKSDQLVYPVVNLIGAGLHLISLYRFYNLPSVIIELFWIAISIYGIISIKKLAKKTPLN
jgi:hypothetical protein